MQNALKNLNYNLLLHTSDTELTKFCTEVLSVGEKYPEIYEAITADHDARGQLKKQLRLLDQQFNNDQTPELPGTDFATLFTFFSNLNIKMPAPTTILENINCLSRETRDLIMKCQLRWDNRFYFPFNNRMFQCACV